MRKHGTQRSRLNAQFFKGLKGGNYIFTIRQELQSDYNKVYELVNKAFATASHSDGTEADYLNDVRNKSTFIPELSFVAETENSKIVGQIVLYRTEIKAENATIEALVLSPLSVHPDYFRQGIARQLIDYALKEAATMGHRSVFLCGDPEIYQKLGFRPSYEFNIYHANDPKAEWCMGRELVANSLANISGTIDIV